MSEPAGVDAAKDRLRREILERRARRDDADLVAAGIAIAAAARRLWRGRWRLAAYAEITGEPSLHVVRAEALAAGTEVILPVIDGDRLDWAVLGPDQPLRPGLLGAPAPDGPRLGAAALAAADVVLVPALAVDAAGRRLGRGRGYYDRALRDLDRRRTTVVACVFDDEVVGAVPAASYDVRVDAILTPSGVTGVGA